jgi:hypothetical protein
MEIMEAMAHLITEDDYAAAFELIESDQFDQNKFFSDANSAVWDRRERKFGTRVSVPFVK